MNKLNKTLRDIKQAGRPALMMHIVAGYPDLESSAQIAKTILDAGADLLEIQIPFSDPVADGPVIANANEHSLRGGTTVSSSLDMIEGIVKATAKPILIMSYFNIIHRYGIEKFCEKAVTIGVQGLIVPDYPYDEEAGNSLLEYSKKYSLALIQVLASTTKPARTREIAKVASGFVYCVARTGTTGNKTVISSDTIDYLKTIRQNCNVPMAVGFGLSEKSQIEALQPYADIMIVGSALIKEYARLSIETGLAKAKRFVMELTA